MGLIIDSSIFIAAERRGESPRQVIRQASVVGAEHEVAISAVGLSELVHGIFQANSAERQARRRLFVDELRSALIVYPYTAETAMLAGQIDGEQAARGISIPIADLLIGTTALSLGFSVFTTNARHFRLIPGLTVVTY
jgi:predicted nucleic acid-binding protein